MSAPAPARAQTVCEQLLPIGLVPPVSGFQQGCANHYVLKSATVPSQGGAYAWLDFPLCGNGPCAGLTGVFAFTCAATSGYACCIGASQSISIAAGNYAGPLKQGLGQRFSSDTDTSASICYSDYAGNGARICNVPLIQPVCNGQSHVQVTGFGRMFLLRPPSGGSDILVEFITGPTPTRDASWGGTKIRYR